LQGADPIRRSAAIEGQGNQAPPTVAERRAWGKHARKRTPRGAIAGWRPPADRCDPLTLLREQDRSRLPGLVPVRYGRMVASLFGFFRGTAAVMACDLSRTPASGLTVQLCGDAHLGNFGVYASPERALLFDVNDFDDTLPGPWEWDLRRLATSAVIAARTAGFDGGAQRQAALVAVRAYRRWMARYAGMGDLDVWYSRVRAVQALGVIKETAGVAAKAEANGLAPANTRDSLQAQKKLTAKVDGQRRIVDDPPLVEHLAGDELDAAESVRQSLDAYRRTLEDDRRALLERYSLVDFARKAVGVSSLGTRCYIVLLQGSAEKDPLFLQIKQAGRSALEPYLGPSRYRNHAHRVVAGQRLMQAASDIFLGWIRDTDGRDFYWRQLSDMKGSVAVAGLKRPTALEAYVAVCAWALARAHACSGDRFAIAAYLGGSDRLDRAVADFASTYADQVERDYERLLAAVAGGEVQADIAV
jgi:uncharacterized protein (DUF2252 family)